jgi:hypothetical protein
VIRRLCQVIADRLEKKSDPVVDCHIQAKLGLYI